MASMSRSLTGDTLASKATRRNYVELPYRGVSVQPYDGEMTVDAITNHLLGKEAYRRTNAIVLHRSDNVYALVVLGPRDGGPLFSLIRELDVIALPNSCHFVVDPETDCGNPSALARLAEKCGVGLDGTLICQGKFDHVNFIHRPDPLLLRVVEVSPPNPPKLLALIEHVLSYADLPPIKLIPEIIAIQDIASKVRPELFLAPCRSGGLDELPAPVRFLDERPAVRENWVLIGCERSLQFHRHYYGDDPLRIEMCPRALATDKPGLTILKCCLLEFDIEREGDLVVVPWGANLEMIERALKEIVRHAS